MAEPESPEEEVVVRLASMPQIISPEGVAPGGGGGAGGGRAAGAGGGAAAGAGAELGRRLLLAARAGDTAAVLDLMAQGAPFTTDWLGTSPLHLAALGGHAGTCAVLLRAGVSRDARTKVERTPLHLAAHAGHAAAAAVLLDHGATVDCRDMLRMTPLHWACARGHAGLAALLVRRGADPRARCKFRRSARSLAATHPAVRAAVAAAGREREQASVREEMAVEGAAEQKPYETVPMLVPDEKPDCKPPAPAPAPPKLNKINLETEQTQQAQPAPATGGVGSPAGVGAGAGAGPGGDSPAAAALLRQHGITLLPADDGGTVLSALQSGRTVVLSDAGKLMLKENSAPTPAPLTPVTPVTPLTPVAPRAGVVVRACPAREPPRPGVKVFTVNKLEPEKRDLQIKYVQLPADATILSPHKTTLKAKSKVGRASPVAAGPGSGSGAAAGSGPAAGNRPGVKIIMNKASFSKLLATATRAHHSGDNEPLSLGAARGEAVVCVPEQFVRSQSARYLRAQLLAAHAALAELQRQLRDARRQLHAPRDG